MFILGNLMAALTAFLNFCFTYLEHKKKEKNISTTL
jgi:hypothetical protein